MIIWSAEFYENIQGGRPVESWLDSLTEQKFAAMDAAILLILQPRGLTLGDTKWLTALGGGLWEFRVRNTASEIKAMYSDAAKDPTKVSEKILLRLFVHFYGQKVVLLLHGYDKAGNDSQRNQEREINLARKRLKEWKARTR